MSTPAPLLDELLDAVLCGSATDEVCDDFRRMLDQQLAAATAVGGRPPELRELVEQLRTHSLLEWAMKAPQITFAACPLDSNPPERPIVGRRWPTRLASAAALVGIAAALLVTGLWGWTSDTGSPLGVVSLSPGAVITKTSTAVSPGGKLCAGRIELTSGRASISFATGVEMEVAGPARCEIVSTNLVRLQEGQTTAEVPSWAVGFTVETEDVDVIDLGTRFGVAKYKDKATDIIVFEGEVNLKSADRKIRPFERRLTQGEAASVDGDGNMQRIFQVHGEWNGNGWSTDPQASNNSAIAAVWDNLGATKSVSYYQVLTAGLDEDAPAYVDHPHQWNSLNEAGLPDFLRGADYVRTVNDYRYLGELVIQVEFAADADLYIFFDNRVALPDWLPERFADTGVDIGLDEDAWFGNPEFTVEEGAGKSVDNVFSVWRRPCRRSEVLVLGSMGIGREARAMYGMAAKRTE